MTLSPWQPERVVAPELAAHLVRSQFPALDAARVEPIGGGWDYTAFLIDDRWVFRFPHRTEAVECLKNELRALPVVAQALPAPVPMLEWIGQPTASYPWPFVGCRLLCGRAACQAGLGPAQRTALAPVLGALLSTLHRLEVCGLPGDTFARADVRRRTPVFLERLAALEACGVITDGRSLRRLLAQSNPRPPTADGSLVHGDLNPRHLIVNDAGNLAGVIDWGDVHIGDPAVDLAIGFGFLAPPARGSFFEAYGRVDRSTHDLARALALFRAVASVYYGNELGDEPLRREGLAALEHVVA